MNESEGHVANVAHFSACSVFPLIFLAACTHPACKFDPAIAWRELDRESTLVGLTHFQCGKISHSQNQISMDAKVCRL